MTLFYPSETPSFTWSDKTTTPGLNYQVLFGVGGISFYPSPKFPIFDLVHVQLVCLFQYKWTAVYLNSFYPVTGLPTKRTAVTRTAHNLVNFGTGP